MRRRDPRPHPATDEAALDGLARNPRGSGSPWSVCRAPEIPIIAAAVWPLAKLDAELVRNYLFELRQWEQLDKDEKKTEPKPVQKRLRLEDTTIEAAQEALAGSPNGVLLVQDELSGFFGSLDKYSGTAKNRSFWLQSYNGGQYAISRIVRGVGLVPNLSVCMLGGIEPDVIRQLAAESQDDGFLQRMMVVVLRPAGIGLDVPRPSAGGATPVWSNN